MAVTKKTNVIIPQIMGPAINARLDKALKLMPYAKIDDTLEGTEGDTVKIPVWDYAGDAVEVAEGEEVETSALSCDVREYTVKKAMKAFPITDEAQLSTRGLGEQAERQLVLSIKGKIEQDLNDACYESASVKTVEHDGQIDYTAIVRGASAFGLETNPQKVILIHPNQEAAILNSNYFKNLSKFGKHVGIDGVIGMIAGCWIKKSKRVQYVEATTEHGAYYLNPIVIIDNEESAEEDPTPALTIFVKREFELEVSRDALSQTLALVGSKHYLAALTNSAKVVLLKNIVSDALPCTLSYNANGGTGSMDPQTGLAGTDLTVADNEFTREGYSFAKWNTKADGTGTDYDPDDTLTIEADTTLYAQWVINRTLSYDANGGEGSMDPEIVEDGGTLTVASNTFTRSGYNFVKWNTAADGSGTDYDPADSITMSADVTLYAIWTIAEYTITFNANGGSGSMSAQTVNAGESATLTSNTFTKTGYEFDGWNTAADGSGTSYADGATITPSADVTLYAQWAEESHPWASCGDATVIHIDSDNGLTYHFRNAQHEEITPAVGDSLAGCEYYTTGINSTGKEKYWLAYNGSVSKKLLNDAGGSTFKARFEPVNDPSECESIGSAAHTIGNETTYSVGKYYTSVFLSEDTYYKTVDTLWKQLLTIRTNTQIDDWFIPSLDELRCLMDDSTLLAAWIDHSTGASNGFAWSCSAKLLPTDQTKLQYGYTHGYSSQSAAFIDATSSFNSNNKCVFMRCF